MPDKPLAPEPAFAFSLAVLLWCVSATIFSTMAETAFLRIVRTARRVPVVPTRRTAMGFHTRARIHQPLNGAPFVAFRGRDEAQRRTFRPRPRGAANAV